MHFGLEEWVAGGTPYVEYTDVDGGALVSLVFAAVVSAAAPECRTWAFQNQHIICR